MENDVAQALNNWITVSFRKLRNTARRFHADVGGPVRARQRDKSHCGRTAHLNPAVECPTFVCYSRLNARKMRGTGEAVMKKFAIIEAPRPPRTGCIAIIGAALLGVMTTITAP